MNEYEVPDWMIDELDDRPECQSCEEAAKDYEELEKVVGDLALLVKRLSHSLRKASPDNALPEKALDYLKRKELLGSPVRKVSNVEVSGMLLYHATTPKKVQHYHASGRIIAPVRGFTTLTAAMAWACKTGRSVVLAVQGEDCHTLPDHHNAFGEAWWVDHDVSAWKCILSPKDA